MSMVPRRRRSLAPAAVAGALGLGGVLSAALAAPAASPSAPPEPTREELLQRLRTLRGKLETLEAAEQAAPATRPAATPEAPRDADAEGATVGSVLDDAQRRSRMLQVGGLPVVAGHRDGMFFIQDEAGRFLINPNLQFQFRHVVNVRSSTVDVDPDDDDTDEDPEVTGDDHSRIESGFEVARLKFAFDGYAFGPRLTYKFRWETQSDGGSLTLEDAWVKYAFADSDFAVRAGQFKDPTFHEELVGSQRQLAVDRSLVNEVVGGGLTDYVQGVALVWNPGSERTPVRAEAGFSDGINTDNTGFAGGGGSPEVGAADPDWGLFARVEYKPFGDWRQYEDFTALGNARDMLVLGAGATYTEAGDGDALLYTFDVQYETGSLGLYAAYYGAYGEPQDETIEAGSTHDSGILVQAGQMLTDKWELFGRFDTAILDTARFLEGEEQENFQEFTVGLNYYLRGHAAKFTIDASYLPNGTPRDVPDIGLIDPDGDEDQYMLRTQFQLLL